VISLTGIPLGHCIRRAKAVVGLLTTNGSGALSLTYDENFCSAPNSYGAPGTYSEPPMAGIDHHWRLQPVAYLMDVNQIFVFVSDVNVFVRRRRTQTAVSFPIPR